LVWLWHNPSATRQIAVSRNCSSKPPRGQCYRRRCNLCLSVHEILPFSENASYTFLEPPLYKQQPNHDTLVCLSQHVFDCPRNRTGTHYTNKYTGLTKLIQRRRGETPPQVRENNLCTQPYKTRFSKLGVFPATLHCFRRNKKRLPFFNVCCHTENHIRFDAHKR
jgi:hypothetical protein